MQTKRTMMQNIAQNTPKMIDLSMFNEEVGEEIQSVSADALGKYKLNSLLRKRFGVNFRGHPVGQKVINAFEHCIKMSQIMR